MVRNWRKLGANEQIIVDVVRVTAIRGIDAHELGELNVQRLKSDSKDGAKVLSYGFGTCFGGRPIHEWYFYFRGISAGEGKLKLTHYFFAEEHVALHSPTTMGFGLMMPDVVRPFETCMDERLDMLSDALSYLTALSENEAKAVITQ